ncbi:Uncharacterised protein [Segatella copri]|nr:Uncharacterised protein [Segatella copri]
MPPMSNNPIKYCLIFIINLYYNHAKCPISKNANLTFNT